MPRLRKLRGSAREARNIETLKGIGRAELVNPALTQAAEVLRKRIFELIENLDEVIDNNMRTSAGSFRDMEDSYNSIMVEAVKLSNGHTKRRLEEIRRGYIYSPARYRGIFNPYAMLEGLREAQTHLE